VDATLIDEQAPLSSVRRPAATTTPSSGSAPDPRQRRIVVVLAGLAAGAAVVAAIGYRMGSGPAGERSPGGSAAAAAALSMHPREEEPGALPHSASAGAAADTLPPLVNVTNARTSPPASSAAGARVAVAIDASSARPGVGEPVDLSARVMGANGAHPKIEGAKFRIKGPGIVAGTELAALDDGTGVLKTTFTFLQPGRYEVGFSAVADGVGVKSARPLVVDDPSAPAAAPAPPAAAPAPAGSGSAAKWL
jgi:hypothetical protein